VPLWTATDELQPNDQTLIVAPTVHVAYARLRALYQLRDGHGLRGLVCRVDDPSDAQSLPPDYPDVAAEDQQAWFTGLVDWWQRERSELVGRRVAPFNHGDRIFRRWGDQVDRAVRMLNARDTSSRALIQLITPRETGRYLDDRRDLQSGSFPAFVLVEFSVSERDRSRYVDCVGYFRKQEMQYWWPVNMAELARLQERVRAGLRPATRPGHITTFSAIALWNNSLPRVAVPVVDLLVEEPERLWDMAVAVAFPSKASNSALSDWRHVLSDLAGHGRSAPPKVSAGVAALHDHVQRLTSVISNAALSEVAEALRELDNQYEAHADREELPGAAAKVVRERIDRLSTAVGEVLPQTVPSLDYNAES
jgi:hypothetical protein